MDIQKHRPEERHGDNTDSSLEECEMTVIEIIGGFIMVLGVLFVIATL